MAIQVEQPSHRTPEERVREGIGFRLKRGVRLAIAASLGFIVTFSIVHAKQGTGGFADVMAILAGLATFLFILTWRYGKPVSEQPEVLEEEQETEEEELFPAGTVILGFRADSEEDDDPVGLEPEMRNRHVYVVGKTRTGKTTLLRNMIIQDLDQEHGVAFIDPHGDAAEELLGLIPENRIEELVYFDPRRTSAPSFNPFQLPYPAPKLTEDIVSVFRMLTGGGSWGPRMEHLLRFGILTLLSDKAGGHSLAQLRSLYLDPDFRSQVFARLESPQLLEFWEHEFPMIPESASAPILNKLSAFLAPMSDLERVFSAPRNDLDFAEILNGGKILIVNLAKGTIGDEPARLLGGLLVTGIQQAALARASLPPEARAPFYLYVDEFQNFTVASFESILSESAKYQLNLTLANQNLGQLSSSLQSSIFGNCASLVAFQVSAEDAPKLCREMQSHRVVARGKHRGNVIDIQDFLAEQRKMFRDALDKKCPREDYQLALRQAQPLVQKIIRSGTSMRKRPDHRAFRHILSRLNDPELSLTEIRNLFARYWTFEEMVHPSANDLVDLPSYHAFCKIGRADSVTVFRALNLEDRPSPTVRAAVEKHIEGFKAPDAAPEPPKTRRVDEPESFLE